MRIIMKTKDKGFLIVERSEKVDVNEVRFLDTGDTSIIWQIMAAGVFPEWVLDYLHHSARKMVDLSPGDQGFNDQVVKALAIRPEHFAKDEG